MRLVLLGAGHAHLYTLKRTAEIVRRGFEVVLVAPDSFWYSGLATGMLGGMYPPSLDRIDAGALVERGGGRFIRDCATGIDPAARTVQLAEGGPLPYDVLSLNLGSEVPSAQLPGSAEHGWPVKPIRNLWLLREELEERLAASRADRPVRVAVVGGGATGCEVAANIDGLARRRAGRAAITVLSGGERALEDLPRRAAEKAVKALEKRGVKLLFRARVVEVKADRAVTADGREELFDVLVSAIGLKPPALLRSSGLPTDGEGALLVDRHLRSAAFPGVHGAGDCISFEGRRLPRIGVHAVRQAPVLHHNLLASLEGRPPRPFRPQRRYLLILNLGDGTGLATWGRFSFRGKLALRLKDRLDRRFLAEYQA